MGAVLGHSSLCAACADVAQRHSVSHGIDRELHFWHCAVAGSPIAPPVPWAKLHRVPSGGCVSVSVPAHVPYWQLLYLKLHSIIVCRMLGQVAKGRE